MARSPLKLEASSSFYTKEGSKVKDTLQVIARPGPRVQGRLLIAAMNRPLILVYGGALSVHAYLPLHYIALRQHLYSAYR